MNARLHLWLYRLFFLALSLLVIAIPLLPLGFSPERMVMPDLFLVLAIVWVIREKNTAPLILIAGLALLADAVLMRPIGLWAALIVIASELIRMNDRLIREAGIVIEVVFFSLAMSLMLFLQNALLFLVFADPYPPSKLIQIVILSAICYPFFALLLHYVLRVRGPVTKNLPDRLGKVG